MVDEIYMKILPIPKEVTSVLLKAGGNGVENFFTNVSKSSNETGTQ